MNQIDVKIKEVAKQEFKNLQSSQLIIELSGKTVNSTLVNTIRRLSYDHVPTYAFPAELITIDKNISVFDNDYMRLRLSQITIPKISNDIYFLDDEFWKDINFANPNRNKHPDDNKILELYINATNDTEENMNVTTEHVRVFENGVELKGKFDPKFPHLIIQLRPGGAFSCRCVGALSIGKNNHIFSACGNSYFDNVNDDLNKFHLTLESQGQMDEYEILIKSCLVIKEKLRITKELIVSQYNLPKVKESNDLKVELQNEDHTLGNVINEYLQDHKGVLYAGVAKPNLLVDTMIISISTIKKNPLNELGETIDHIIKIFDHIENQIKKLSK